MEQRSLGLSFGAAAVAYAEHRPDYATAAVSWALEPAPGRRVLDLGAGTGKLTATLVALGLDVVAVEPDAAMLNQLPRAMPTVRALPHLSARFGATERAEFANGQRRTADSLVETFGTKAGILVMPTDERTRRLAEMRDYLANRPETADGEFTLPMLTAVLRSPCAGLTWSVRATSTTTGSSATLAYRSKADPNGKNGTHAMP